MNVMADVLASIADLTKLPMSAFARLLARAAARSCGSLPFTAAANKKPQMRQMCCLISKLSITPKVPNVVVSPQRLSSTLKKRAWKMNKHKLKKRRKALRMNSKIHRGRL